MNYDRVSAVPSLRQHAPTKKVHGPAGVCEKGTDAGVLLKREIAVTGARVTKTRVGDRRSCGD